AADAAELNALLVADGLRVAEIRPQRHTLEEVVLSLTGTSADRFDRLPGGPRQGSPQGPPDGPVVDRVDRPAEAP
ncbi:hypothetical protein AB0J52_25735, partial [Spirillospora sp. NPDC049652]